MSDQYVLRGSYTVTPPSANVTGCLDIFGPIDETLQLAAKDLFETTLTADAPVVVDFGGVTNAAVVCISTDRKVQVRLTSADGATQAVPVDTFLKLISKSVPITALDLTRVTGQDTKVKVFLGEST